MIDDLEQWEQKIRDSELSFVDQCKIVHDLHNAVTEYQRLYRIHMRTRSKVVALSKPVDGLIQLARSGADDATMAAGLRFWTDQIVAEVFGGE